MENEMFDKLQESLEQAIELARNRSAEDKDKNGEAIESARKTNNGEVD